MDSDRDRINQIYQEALRLTPEQRTAFIQAATEGQENLRLKIETLLSSQPKAEKFLADDALHSTAKGVVKERSLIGQQIGAYKIVSLLGAGGMGEVYKAVDTRLNRTVAIKFLLSQLSARPDLRKRFEREARSISNLNHPHICTLYDIGEQDGLDFLVMEYLEGNTLADQLKEGCLPPDQVLQYALQIGDALAQAHAQGVIHRDLKPGNVMLTSRGAKLLDFGLAKLEAEPQPSGLTTVALATEGKSLTAEGIILGTLEYMAPEQLEGKEADARSDVFSLGTVIYEMATGKKAFTGDSKASVIVKILTREPPSVTSLQPLTPPEMEKVVEKCLRKEPKERWQDAAEVTSELKRIAGNAAFLSTLQPIRRNEKERSEGEAAIGSESSTIAESGSSSRSFPRQIHASLSASRIVFGLIVLALAIGIYVVSRGSSTIDSLAVLPFENATGDTNSEYLSDGITETLINTLARLPNLKVISRASAFRYKGLKVDPHAVGQTLGVRAIIMGRIVQHAEDLSISAELVDTNDNRQIWGERYQQKPAEILTMQEEIVKQILSKLHLRLNGEEEKRSNKRFTQNVEAYRLYLKGRYFLNKYNQEGFKTGLEYFKQAIDLDPNYAQAWSGLADSYYQLSSMYLRPKEVMPKAAAAATKALEIDGTLGEAHTSLAIIKSLYNWDWLGAEREFKRALELNPGYAFAHLMYGLQLVLVGRPEEAKPELARAAELDPLSPSTAVTAVWPLFMVPRSARQHDRAIQELRKIISSDPNFLPPYRLMARVYADKGMFEQAIEVMLSIRHLDDTSEFLGVLGYLYAKAGKKTEAQKMLVELQQRAKHEHVAALTVALVYIGLGEKDSAFAWLMKACDERDEEMGYAYVCPWFDTLRPDPRFSDILKYVGLPLNQHSTN